MGSCAPGSARHCTRLLLRARHHGDGTCVTTGDEDARLALRPSLQASAVVFVIFTALVLFT